MQADKQEDISEGEIVDDDNEESELKEDVIQIKFPAEKLQKNFRKSNQIDSDEEIKSKLFVIYLNYYLILYFTYR
jgi:hypothetical protein